MPLSCRRLLRSFTSWAKPHYNTKMLMRELNKHDQWQVKRNVNAVFRQMHRWTPYESGLGDYIPSCPWVALTIFTTVHFNVQHTPLKLLQFLMIHISYTLLIFSPYISQQKCICVKGEKLLISCVYVLILKLKQACKYMRLFNLWN